MLLVIMHLIHLVDGGWGEWEEWNNCTVTCGGGEKSRIRLCDTPKPKFGGQNCTYDVSNSTETQQCNENICLGKQAFYKG